MKKNIFNIILNETKKIHKGSKFKFLKNKTILITGATGLLGNYMVAFFFNTLESKYSPKKISLIFKNNLPSYLNFLKVNKKIDLIQKDLTKLNASNIKKQDYIIHLAGYGQPFKFMKNEMKTFHLNTVTLECLIRRTKSNGNFLYLSSSEIYSGLNGMVNENQVGNTNTDHPRSCYIESKRGGETILNIYKKKLSIKAKSARLCLAYGPGTKKGDARVLNQFIEKGLSKKNITMNDSGTAIRSYIYVADATKMLLNILFFGKHSIYNVGGKEKISIKKLANKIGKILKAPVMESSKIYSKKIGSPKHAMVDIGLYEKEFKKMSLTKLDEGLRNTIEWQRIVCKY